MPDPAGFDQRIQGIETLVRRVEALADPAACALAKELVQAVMDLHAAALQRILEMIFDRAAAGGGAPLIDALGDDQLAGSLLLLHGLHPLDLPTRVGRALEKASLVVHAHGGRIELVGIADATVTLRLHNIPDSAAAGVKAAVDREIYAYAPDVVAIRGLESIAGADFFPIAQLAAPVSAKDTVKAVS